MIRKPSVGKSVKQIKSEKSQEDGCSRVGNNFQVPIPNYIGQSNNLEYDDANPTEFSVWIPPKQSNVDKLKSYFEFAAKYNYSEELASIFLHWHDYDIKKAMDDIPNFVPASKKWTKSEVRKFLKCIDSKPRKNFVEAKKTVPGRHMGDICTLYYSIAAPFKAHTRTKCHNELIDQCFNRALRNGMISNRWHKSPLNIYNNMSLAFSTSRRPGCAEDSLECQIELHLIKMVGTIKTIQLLSKELINTPYPLLNDDANKVTQNSSEEDYISKNTINANGNVVNRTQDVSVTNSINGNGNCPTNSSDSSSQVESVSTISRRRSNHDLPPGINYNHEDFVQFISHNPDELISKKLAELADLDSVKEDLYERVQRTESRSRNLLNKIDLLKPIDGFPQISYRWTKVELAFVLLAMCKFGDDFAQIAKIIGTKTESFIMDFYNQFRSQFDLDSIIKLSGKPTQLDQSADQLTTELKDEPSSDLTPDEQTSTVQDEEVESVKEKTIKQKTVKPSRSRGRPPAEPAKVTLENIKVDVEISPSSSGFKRGKSIRGRRGRRS